MQMLEDEGGDILLDLHEAYPEYPIINMLVVHQNAFEIGTLTALNMQVRGAPMDVMPSPENLHGLSHREFGDYADAYALLSETANPAMGRLRGKTDAALITEGRDDNYVRAAELGLLFVPFDEDGWPLDTRVARQLLTIEEMLAVYNETNPDRPVVVSNLPLYEDVISDGIGAFLLPADGP